MVALYVLSPLRNEVFNVFHSLSHYIQSNIAHTHHHHDDDHDHHSDKAPVASHLQEPDAHSHAHELLSFVKKALGFADSSDTSENPPTEFKFPKHILPLYDTPSQLLSYRSVRPIFRRGAALSGRDQDVTTPPPQAC